MAGGLKDDLKVLKNIEALIRHGFSLQSISMKGPSGTSWIVQAVEQKPLKRKKR